MVFDTKMKVRSLIIAATAGLSAVVSAEKKEINVLEDPEWLASSGVSRGTGHDRQDLGVVLEDGAQITIKQTNSQYKESLTLELLTDDSDRDGSVSFNATQASLKSNGSSVAFVRTPLVSGNNGTTKPQIEYQISGDKLELPTFENGNDDEFLDKWDQNNASFALIKGSKEQILLPVKDKQLASNMTGHESISALVKYLDSVLNYYDKMIGLDNSSSTDKAVQTRYFMRADIHGAGSAYYSGSWTGQSADTASMWLEKDGWGTFHEIAHGYQAGFDGNGMYTGEVSNNLFNVEYLYEHNPGLQDKDNWLWSYGKKQNTENEMYQQAVVNGTAYDDLEANFQLLVLVMLKQGAGNGAFTQMYREYRKESNEEGFNAEDYTLPDLMNKHYSEYSKKDFEPALKRWNLTVEPARGEMNRQRNYPAVAYLADLVPNNTLPDARELVDKNHPINSSFVLVTNDEIKDLNLKGQIKFTVQSSDLPDGFSFSLNEGDKVVKNVSIGQNSSAVVSDVPNGIYTIKLPSVGDKFYAADDYYVYVREQANSKTLSIKQLKNSDLVDQSIKFSGQVQRP
jgi:hypothetical protein